MGEKINALRHTFILANGEGLETKNENVCMKHSAL